MTVTALPPRAASPTLCGSQTSEAQLFLYHIRPPGPGPSSSEYRCWIFIGILANRGTAGIPAAIVARPDMANMVGRRLTMRRLGWASPRLAHVPKYPLTNHGLRQYPMSRSWGGNTECKINQAGACPAWEVRLSSAAAAQRNIHFFNRMPL